MFLKLQVYTTTAGPGYAGGNRTTVQTNAGLRPDSLPGGGHRHGGQAEVLCGPLYLLGERLDDCNQAGHHGIDGSAFCRSHVNEPLSLLPYTHIQQ